MRAAKILIVDDEPQIRRVLRLGLSTQGYHVEEADSGEEAVEQLSSLRPDVVLLDIKMPGINGVETCRLIRETSSAAIIMLTVRKSDEEKVAALDAGANDFVIKPFSMPELLARIRSNLRRIDFSRQEESILTFDDIQVNLATRRVTVSGKQKRFTPKEFDLLGYLVTNPNVVIPHAKLLRAVWGSDYKDRLQYLHVFIMRIRKKIEPDHANPRYILTEPWVGYKFNLPTRPIASSSVTHAEDRERTVTSKVAASVLIGNPAAGDEIPAEQETEGAAAPVAEEVEPSLPMTLNVARTLRDMLDRQIRILEKGETAKSKNRK